MPLLSSAVDVNMIDFTAEVAVTQTFENRGIHPVEAIYIYPVDSLAAVCGFSVDVDGVSLLAFGFKPMY